MQFLGGGVLGAAASGGFNQPNMTQQQALAVQGAASGLQHQQRNEAIQNSGQVNVNINNANQTTASDSSTPYVADLKGNVFMIGVPYFDTKVKQGEVKNVTVSLKRGEYFKQDVKLQIKASAGISVDPTYVLVKASDKPDVQFRITVPKDADLGLYKVSVMGIPTTGESTSVEFRVKVVAWGDDKFVGSQSQVSTGDNQKSQGDSSKFGFVNVTADDPTFEVFADGAFVGNSPAKLKLSEGPHTIEVRKEGFKDYKKEIRVTDGSELNLKVVLEKQ